LICSRRHCHRVTRAIAFATIVGVDVGIVIGIMVGILVGIKVDNTVGIVVGIHTDTAIDILNVTCLRCCRCHHPRSLKDNPFQEILGD